VNHAFLEWKSYNWEGLDYDYVIPAFEWRGTSGWDHQSLGWGTYALRVKYNDFLKSLTVTDSQLSGGLVVDMNNRAANQTPFPLTLEHVVSTNVALHQNNF
jgi:hypothetical protein